MAKQSAFALVILIIAIIGLLLYKKWIGSPNKEGFTTVTNGNVYWVSGNYFSYITVDKAGNIYISEYLEGASRITMYAASTLNPYSQFLTNDSGVLQSSLTPGTLYYLNIGEKRKTTGTKSTPGSIPYPNNIPASQGKVQLFINCIEFDNFNNIYITNTPGDYTKTCAVIYMIASGNTTTSPFVTGTLVAGNIYAIAGKTDTAILNTRIPQTLSLTDGTVSRSEFKFSITNYFKIDIYNNIYVADVWLTKIFLIPSTSANPFPQLITGNLIPGNVYLLAGQGTTTGDGGIALNAKFSDIRSFTIDSSLNIYIADSSAIRMICGPNTTTSPFICHDSSGNPVNPIIPGNIYRIAGGNGGAKPGSGIPALSCRFNNIGQIIIDSQGNIHISDTSNQLIRMISATDRSVNGLTIYPQTVGLAQDTTTTPTIENFKKSYIYNIVGVGDSTILNNPTLGNSKPIHNVNIYPIKMGIDIFGNYYFTQYEMGGYVKTGFFKVIMNTFTCPTTLPTGITTCTSTSSDTPGFVICDAGYENTDGKTCTPCSLGYYCPQISDTNGTPIGNLKIPCGTGTYNPNTSASNVSACLNCAAGSYSIGGRSNCSLCTAGTYSSIPGSPVCSSCPSNSTCYTGGTDATTTGLVSFACSAGRYAKDGACASCPASSTCYPGGVDADRIGLTSFTCPVGYSNNGSNCVPCAPGYSNTGSNCVLCSPGYYCSGTSNTPCDSNTANSNTGSSNVAACISCGDGFYSGLGSTQCAACVENSISCTSAASFICKPGYSNNGSGCVLCSPGYYCSGTSNTACPSGTANSNTGSSIATVCKICGTGYYSGEGSSQCTACVENSSSCISGTSFTCARGYYSNADECSPCRENAYDCISPTSFRCAAGSYSNTGGCSYCPANSTCSAGSVDAGTIGLTSFTCARGYYSNADECSPCHENAYDCISPTSFRCAAGSYSNTGGCSYCPANSTCSAGGVDAGTIGVTSFTCKEGYYDKDGICKLIPLDCIVSDWSPCSLNACGSTGTQTRTITRASANGGLECPPLLKQQCVNPPCTAAAPNFYNTVLGLYKHNPILGINSKFAPGYL